VPLVGGVTSWLLLGEGFGLQKVAGAVLAIAGLALARRAASQPKPVPAVAPTPAAARG
jgi:drug/metabolite transporter (DMT)-like permease